MLLLLLLLLLVIALVYEPMTRYIFVSIFANSHVQAVYLSCSNAEAAEDMHGQRQTRVKHL